MHPADGSKLDARTRAALEPIIKASGLSFEEAGVSGAAISLLMKGQGTISAEHKALLLRAYAQHGFNPPAGAKPTDLIAAMDAVTDAEKYSPAFDNRTSYGVAMALKANRPDVAMTLADTPDGAGIGWTLTRDDLDGRPEGNN